MSYLDREMRAIFDMGRTAPDELVMLRKAIIRCHQHFAEVDADQIETSQAEVAKAARIQFGMGFPLDDLIYGGHRIMAYNEDYVTSKRDVTDGMLLPTQREMFPEDGRDA